MPKDGKGSVGQGLTLYLGENLSATDGNPISPTADRLVIENCKVGGVKLPKIELHLPTGARVFYFDGPILVIENDNGYVLERIAPIYVRL